jgi:Outer membrane protein beta-barrel domain
MIKVLILFYLILTTLVFSQSDTLDTILLDNGDVLKGKLLRIKPEAIEFFESSTFITYEFEKSKIDSVILSDGKILNFMKNPPSTNEPKPPLKEEAKKDTNNFRLAIGGGVLFAFKSDNYANGTGVDLFLEIGAATLISVEANIGWYSANTNVDYLSKGNASFTILELSLLLRDMSGGLQPFAGIGIGYYSITNELDEEVIQYLNEFGLTATETVESDINFHVRGGIQFMLSPNFGFSFDFKYLIFNPTAITTVKQLSPPYQSNTVEDQIKLNNLNLIFGLVVVL